MHPVLGSRARLGTYLLAWVPGMALLAGQFLAGGWSLGPALALAVPAGLLGSALFLSSWYLCRVAPLRPDRSLGLLATWAAASASMGALWAGAVWLLFRLLLDLGLLGGAPAAPVLAAPELLRLAGTGAVFHIVTVAFNYLLIAQERAREAETAGRDLRELAREAELRALRAQLDPHFLFNSLNSISALTTLDPPGARRMCVLLAEFLRSSLRLGEQSLAPLAQELELLRAYLAIEQVRFGSRLQVDWEVDPRTETALLPPLLLQPLVENAIKHGIAQLPEGGRLRLRAHPVPEGPGGPGGPEAGPGRRLQISLDNPVDPDAPAPVGLGLGLQQVRRRLRGRFGPGAGFSAGPVGDRFLVVLTFPESDHD
jgi:two-component sensor histidine kinase